MSTKIFTFKYLPIPKRDPKTQEIIGEVHYPVVPIRASYGHRLGRIFHALIDSGAGRNLFPAELGELVGISIRKGKAVDIRGIGDVEIKGFTHKIKIYIGTTGFHTEADFSCEQQVPLLGRDGFFHFFRSVTFQENEKVVKLTML